MDLLTCQLCGLEFDRDNSGCSTCPLSSGNHLACCPRCGYQVVGQSRTLDLIGRICAFIRRKFLHKEES